MKGIKKLVLSECSRNALLVQFPPKFSSVFATHITLEFGELSHREFDFTDVSIVGYQSTSYLEVLVVSIDNSYTRLSDKQILHITLSTQPGIPPVCSNDVLNELLFQPLHKAFPIQVELRTILFN